MNKLNDILATVTIGAPQTYENLTIYPLTSKNGHARAYQTLDEAMKAGTFEVTEVSEGGSVPTLLVKNKGALPVLLIVGEELVGARQNRILNTSLLVASMSDLYIPVTCVERSRWGYTGIREFDTSDSMAHAGLRKMQTEKVTENLGARQVYESSQGEVWQEVERKMASHSTSSSTRALHDVYTQTQETMSEYLKAFTPPDSQGILITINGEVVAADLFDHHETLKVLFPKLLRGYALDALERKNSPARAGVIHDTQTFVTAVQSATDQTFDAVGLGKDVRLTSPDVSGSGLLWEEKVIHASLFNAKV